MGSLLIYFALRKLMLINVMFLIIFRKTTPKSILTTNYIHISIVKDSITIVTSFLLLNKFILTKTSRQAGHLIPACQ